MTERTVSVKLKADVAGFKQAMADAGQSVDKTTQKTTKSVADQKQAVKDLATGMVIAGGAATAFALLAVKKFADFDQAMSNVAATGAEAKASIDDLRTAAIEAGKATVYSASEAAAAEESLAKAGVSAKDILGGALTGSLNLAAAGAMNVADAADITSVALNQFKLSGDKASHVSDLLAAGAGKAMGDVSDLGMALKQSGLVAAQTGISLEETTGTLAAFAQAGLIGSDAGTSFKTMLQRLTPQSKEAQAEFDKLGISAYDSQGNFVGLANFAGQLKDKMSGLTPEARNAALAVMFGSDAVRAASVLYDQGAAGIQAWTTAVDDSGYAAKVAGTRLDNLKGDLEQLSGSVETALIKMGSGSDGMLRTLTQSATGVVNAFADASPEVQNLTLAITGGGGLVALGAAGLGKLVVTVNEVKTAMAALRISAGAATLATAGIGGALIVGTSLLLDWGKAAQESKQNTDDFRSTLDKTTGAVTASTKASAADKIVKTGAAEVYKNLGGNIADLTGYVMGNADAIERVNKVLDAQPKESFFWWTGDNVGVDQTRKDLNRLAEDLKGSQEEQRNAILAAGDALDSTAGSTTAATSALATYAKATEDGTATTQQYTSALAELVDAQNKAAGVVLSERDAQRAFEAAIDDASTALKENGTNLDITTEKGRANQAALDAVAKSGWDVIASMQANGATSADLQGKMQAIRDTFIKVAESEGQSADQANALADQLGLLPSKVDVQVAADTSAARRAIDQFLAAYQGAPVRIAVTGGSGGITKASGGYISGPGTSTSDSIPALLSDGEYVVKASSVAQYGRAFFDSVNAGRFASGGMVGSGSAAPITFPDGPATAVFSDAQVDVLARAIATRARTEAAGVVSDVQRAAANSRGTQGRIY